CKPTAGNGGHKMNWYSWSTVYVTGSPLLFGVLSTDWMNRAVWGRGRALWDALLRCYSRFIKRKASI
ncbi:hypothetical protein, partial [Faecalicatena contorta]|uniref:hypothetical protein n=1 Tax=Faecalicatena contorta TaxID=39482 RepID=UPI0031D8E438